MLYQEIKMIRRSERLSAVTIPRRRKITKRMLVLISRAMISFDSLSKEIQCRRLCFMYNHLSFYFFDFIDISTKNWYQAYNQSFRLLKELKEVEEQGFVSSRNYTLAKNSILKYRQKVEWYRDRMFSVDSWSTLPRDIINCISSYLF